MFERKSSKPERRDDAPAVTIPETAAPVAAKPTANVSASASSTSSSNPRGVRAMIGSKVTVKGDIISGEDLLVEGEVHGTITLTDNELVVGTSGRVEANVNAKTIRIEGEVKGDIDASERVVICASGNVQGNVTAPRVMLEDGGRFKGSIDMGGSGSANARPKDSAPGAKPVPGAAADVRSIDKTG